MILTNKQMLLFTDVKDDIQKQPFADVIRIGVHTIFTGKYQCSEAATDASYKKS